MGSKGSTTTSSTSKLPKEFLTGYTNALKMAGQAVSAPYEAYQGQLVAGLNPSQTQGLANVNAAQGMALPAIQGGMDLTQKAAQGITPELYNQFYSPYVRDVADNTQRNLMESNAQQMSGLKSSAIQGGAFGGDRAHVGQAEMARQQDLANGQTMANIYNQGYGQAMGLAGQQAQNYGAMGQQLAGLGVGAQGSVLQGAQAQMAAGAQQQATEQAQLSAAYDQYMQRLAYPYQQAQFYANIAQGLGSTAGGTSSTTTPGPSWGSQIAGGLGAIGSIFSMSDERMKEDVEPIGELFDGQTIYRYRFKDEPKGTTRIGLMAQDVEKRKPGAVREINGIKGVDYRDATEDAASAGGLVPAQGGRMGFAEGGVPFYPWGDSKSWVPEGKINGGSGLGLPEAPDPYDPKGLGEDWYGLKPLTEDQLSGLNSARLKFGIHLPGDSGDPIMASRGGLARAHYAGGGSSSGVAILPDAPEDVHIPTNEEVDAYVAKAAAAKGIDPTVAVRLWHAEGRSGDPREAWRSKSIIKGKRESSYGPLQLNVEGGVGAQMIKDTGISPADIKHWKESVDYGLGHAKKAGWNDWMGAKAIGLKPYEGISDAPGGVSPVADANPTEDGGTPVPEGGLIIPGERRKFNISKLFANDENPSIIESVMGRRMSPDARNAVMAASFAALAGRSPYMGVNIGEAGKVGMQTYYNALKQKADVANTMSEARLRDVQGTVAEQEFRQKLARLYQLTKGNYEADPINKGKTFIPFSKWAEEMGFPDMVQDTPTISGPGIQGDGTPQNTSTKKTLGEITDPNAPDADTIPGEKPPSAPKAQPLGSPTVLADPKDGPSPMNAGTLPYWQEKLVGDLRQQRNVGLNDPETAATIAGYVQQDQEAISKITGSEEYKNMTNFQGQYQRTLSGLEKLADINANYRGGGLAEAKAEIVRTLQGMGVPLPEGWANEAADFDMTMKGAMDLALRNASQLGALAHAPATAMDAEGHITPTAMMDPVARYDIIRRAIADLHFNHDVYATWDQGYNFAQHQAKFNQKYDYSNYLDNATKGVPYPSVSEGERVPGKTPDTVPVTEQQLNQRLSALETQFPNAPVGTSKWTVINGQNVQFTKTRDGWRAVQ